MDTNSNGDGSSSNITPKRMASEIGGVAIQAPCGACKFLRRKCIPSCIFAPYFDSDQGVTLFAAVHKVFGTSNASKILLRTPPNRRHSAAITISYEAQARLSDPVYGCVSTILALKHQVASLQEELAMAKTQITNSRFAVENALQNSQLFSSNFNLIGETTYHNSQYFDPMIQPSGGKEHEEQIHYPIAFTNQMFR